MIAELLSRAGARLGNWNDRTFARPFGFGEPAPIWHHLDRVAGRLYVLGDRPSARKFRSS